MERLLLFHATARTGPWLGDIGAGWNHAAANPDAYYLTTIPIIYSSGFYRNHNDWMTRRRELLRPVFGDPAFLQAMIRLTNSARNYDVLDQIQTITAPTLVVSARQDYLIPLEEQQLICQRLPHAHHVILPNCGHASMYEQPLLFSMLVTGFCNTTQTEYQILSPGFLRSDAPADQSEIC